MANRSIFSPDKEDPMDPGIEVFGQMVRRDTGGGGAEQLGVPRQICYNLIILFFRNVCKVDNRYL